MAHSDDHQVNIGVNKVDLLHFSDGVDEVIEPKSATEHARLPNVEETVDTAALSWGPWFAHHASRTGNKVLNAVDYAGEGLANFFGITTPKYQIEINEYNRMLEEKKKMDEESAGWVPKTDGGNIPLVLNEPTRSVDVIPN